MDFNAFNQNKKKPNRPLIKSDNFLEALKSIGGGVAQGITKDVAADTAKNAFHTLVHGPGKFSASGELTPDTNLEIDRLQKEQEAQIKKVEHRRLHILKSKEEIIFSAKEEQTQNQIKNLQEELKKMAQDMNAVAKEVQIAAMQEAVDPGQYHVNFFEHLKRLIHALREKLQDSASWLKLSNQRARHKKGFWGAFQKHGTKFSMSEERRKVLQTG